MASIEYNTDTLDPALAAVAAAVEDMSLVMADIGELLVASAQDRMRDGEQPDGSPFAPRSQTTLDRYAKLSLSFGAPLNQSGDMRNTLFYDADKDGVEYGSNAIQAAVMQFGAAKGAFGKEANGASLPWGTIPARPFIGLSDDDEAGILAELEDWLEEAANSQD
ncbi:phage virion morphogenesis protein [Parasedimentitalea marina]|uniref:Phage virion morphogenesis protein n=1 Tax=Parasedimentitalea marina TaxID=2483033 RepID=A0A3T0N1R6_9RHOB|nr:phage virion morphogenesis protein [Parasedimentitalea marina]AZV77941.1 phage virion morphogenesis protein [Parasedimentitalea marina]